VFPFLLATWLATAPGAAPPPGAPSVPTVAVEDTMRTEVSEVLVKAPRVTLDEIIDRVARGEARRDSALHDMAFTLTFRFLHGTSGKDKPLEPLIEKVVRVYKKRPDKLRTVTLREWYKNPKDKDDMNVTFRSRMDEEIVNFAFRPEARRDFKYHIAGRDLIGGHRLIYRIAFEPRSALDPTVPSGVVWVDTNDFVILRQEVSFDRSPVPLFLKGVDRMTIERQRVDDTWVLKRVLLRARMSFSIPKFGNLFDFALLFDDYAVNRGLDDSLFVARR
jgi:hypothetical protein